MNIKEGFIIKKLGIGYIVVTVGDASMDFNGEQPVAVSFASATNNWLQKWVDSYEEFFPKNRLTKKDV